MKNYFEELEEGRLLDLDLDSKIQNQKTTGNEYKHSIVVWIISFIHKKLAMKLCKCLHEASMQ